MQNAPWSARIPFMYDDELKKLSKKVSKKVTMDVDVEGRTVLHLAAEYSYPLLKALLKKKLGGEVNARDSLGNTPLMYAAKSGVVDSIQALVASGASVQCNNDRQETPLHFFAKNNSVDLKQCNAVVGFFADYGLNGYSRDKNHNTPAHTAMLYSNCTFLEYLVEHQYYQLVTANLYVVLKNL